MQERNKKCKISHPTCFLGLIQSQQLSVKDGVSSSKVLLCWLKCGINAILLFAPPNEQNIWSNMHIDFTNLSFSFVSSCPNSSTCTDQLHQLFSFHNVQQCITLSCSANIDYSTFRTNEHVKHKQYFFHFFKKYSVNKSFLCTIILLVSVTFTCFQSHGSLTE